MHVVEDDFLENPDYWHGLINEHGAAEHVGLSVRSLRGYRSKGGGPEFCKISSRCIRYRRIDLKRWVDSRLRASTSEVEK